MDLVNALIEERVNLAAAGAGLTRRQATILGRTALGEKQLAIGARIGISGKTVSVHVHAALLRLGCSTAAHAIAKLLAQEAPELPAKTQRAD